MGSVWQRLGAKVTVVEFLDRIMPSMDGEISKSMQRILAKQGMAFKLSTKVTGAKVGAKNVALTVEPAAGGAAETLEADIVLVAVGRRPYTDGLGLKEAGVALDDKGRVAIDAHFQTNVPGIYAIGDAIAGPMLAHKAEDEGMAVADFFLHMVARWSRYLEKPASAYPHIKRTTDAVRVLPAIRRMMEKQAIAEA